MTAPAQKVAIVTGGARGVGRACAHALAKAGFAIALVDVLEPEMERTAAEIEALGAPAMRLTADVADFARAHAVAKAAKERFGRIKAGAVEFLTKPFGNDVLLSAIRNAIERSHTTLRHETELLGFRGRYPHSVRASARSWRWLSAAC